MNQTVAHMTLGEKVGQMLQVRVFGDSPDFTDPNFLYVRDEIEKYHIGSLDLSVHMMGPNLAKGSPEEVAAILNQLQKDSRLPLLVGGDIERGPGGHSIYPTLSQRARKDGAPEGCGWVDCEPQFRRRRAARLLGRKLLEHLVYSL